MASEDGLRERVGRKLTKRPKGSRRVSLDVPDTLRDGDDANEDASAAPRGREAWNMNQSLFSMIAKTSSQADLHTHLDQIASSESEDEYAGSSKAARAEAEKQAAPERRIPRSFGGRHRRRISDHKLLRSLPRLRTSRDDRDSSADAHMSTSQILPSRKPQDETAKISDKEMKRSHRDSEEVDGVEHVKPERSSRQGRRSRHGSVNDSPDVQDRTKLEQKLKQIFQFDEVEALLADSNCWLMQSVLLQGHLYITQKHICFYSYLAKKESKSGFVAKRGRSKYNRYWFVLKGDVLAYYNDASDLYFPRNRISLTHAVSASIIEPKESDKKDKKEASGFMIEMENCTYKFKADSATSATDWVRAITRVIFRAHNDGSSVKISIPLQNVWDLEEMSLMDFAQTIKIRVIDNDETFAMDEYYFSFTENAQQISTLLSIFAAENVQSDDNRSATGSPRVSTSVRPRHIQDISIESENHASSDALPLRENVRATLAPLPPITMRGSSPRISMESSRSSMDRRRSADMTRSFQRANSDRGRTSFNMHRSASYGLDGSRRGDKSPLSPKIRHSSTSASNSLSRESESSAAIQSLDDTDASASQILNGTDVYRPTIHRSPGRHHEDTDILRQSQETARSLRQNRNSPVPGGDMRRISKRRGPNLTQADGDNDSDMQTSRMRQSESSAHRDTAQAGPSNQKGILEKIKTGPERFKLYFSKKQYLGKVQGLWAGDRKHYNSADGLAPDDQVRSAQEDADAVVDAARFREHFALPPFEELQSTFFASLQRVIPYYGKIYISDRHFCFRSIMPTSRTKLILPLKDIENVTKEKGFRIHYHGLVIVIRGHEEVFFEFPKADLRDECTITLLRQLENVNFMGTSQSLNHEDLISEEQAKAERDMLQEARADGASPAVLPAVADLDPDRMPLIFDDPLASIIDFKPSESLNITCLTIGSRGDVQPYIALCKGLLEEGHKPKIVTHAEFEKAVTEHGIAFAPIAGDPAELMRICVENGMFTVSFLREASEKFRGWIDGLLATAWEACQGSDVLIESPSAMAGIHIAEALRIPYFRAFGMTWTRTRAYPHAFAVQDRKMGGYYNSASYSLFDAVFWKGISGQVNHWRRNSLKIQGTSMAKMKANNRPFLYCFSPSVVPPPIDWPDWIRVTGYWFLDTPSTYQPPADLADFLAQARSDGKKIVYVGFGSIVVEDPAALTKSVVDAVLKADVRCVLSKGWSDRLGKKDGGATGTPLPKDIFQIKEAPHDWLFRQVDAAVHHGGCGTTGASLRAGIPTVIKPFFGDQFFYGMRVEDLGVGICIKKINTTVLGRAIWEAVNDRRMIDKADLLGEKIRRENGVETAIQTLYRELDRARHLIPKEAPISPSSAHQMSTQPDPNESDEDWTIVDDENQASEEKDLGKDLVKWQQMPNVTSGGGSAMALGSLVLRGVGSGKQRGY